jgi:hypothetical protein
MDVKGQEGGLDIKQRQRLFEVSTGVFFPQKADRKVGSPVVFICSLTLLVFHSLAAHLTETPPLCTASVHALAKLAGLLRTDQPYLSISLLPTRRVAKTTLPTFLTIPQMAKRSSGPIRR